MVQKYKSASTSVNSKCKVPRLAKVLPEWMEEGCTILDYGGGKYNTATDYLLTFQIYNRIYDPFNRGQYENIRAMIRHGYDGAMLSNVLNVIMEPEIREEAIRNIWDRLKLGGLLFVSVYEGDKSGVLKVNEKRNSCQLNKRLKEYLPEVQKIFGEHVHIKRTKGVEYILAMKDRARGDENNEE